MYALQPNPPQHNRHHSARQTSQHSREAVAMSPEEFCDKFLPLKYPGEKLDYKSGRRARCVRFLAAVLSRFTTETILESRIDKWGGGLQFAKAPCFFPALLALLAQTHATELENMGKQF
ncbi:hypothetical protein [Laspinema olomoucense]|uniref:hypothetical protein n=1 Tax=Laspinema olomoucense TaxID=3231600 RepID=UPI0021BB3C42|nr:hypothetical protein [Laspinema sp. D3c]MCT7997166.1 hypothetical protein [Laspinema sp. D3c]